MGSYINVEVVQRHLEAVGHKMSRQGVASLLGDLGFSTGTQPRPSKIHAFKHDSELISTNPTPTKPSRNSLRSPFPAAVGGISALLGKLEELEQKVEVATSIQSKLEKKTKDEFEPQATSWKRHNRSVVASPQTQCLSNVGADQRVCSGPYHPQLGNEAQQLRAWADERWSTASKKGSFGSRKCDAAAGLSEEAIVPGWSDSARSSCTESAEDAGFSNIYEPDRGTERCSVVKQQPRGGGKAKKTDPVARYRQLQRQWSRDPFLRSGGATRVTQRKEEGFRSAFAALHVGQHA